VQIGPQDAAVFDIRGRSSRSSRRPNSSSASAAVDWPQLLQVRLQQLAGHAQPLPPVSVEACKVMTQQQLANYWKHHVYTSALLLQQLECAPNAAAAAAAEAAIREYRSSRFFSSFCVVVLNPAGMIRLASIDHENNTDINPHELDQHWIQVLQGLELSEQQQELLMTVFEMIGRDLLAISRQRKRLLGEMILATTAAAKVGATVDGSGCVALCCDALYIHTHLMCSGYVFCCMQLPFSAGVRCGVTHRVTPLPLS
jgi:hypothetical protein